MTEPTLRRELGVGSATLLGLGSILGTGVFVSLGLVTGLAQGWTPVVVLVAALVATCNALSSAQLAAAYPHSGGTYEYGYRLLHPMAGFTAGWMFLCAKSASGAAAALGFAGYLLGVFGIEGSEAAAWIPRLGLALVVLLTALVAGGLRRSSAANTAMVSVVVLSLVAFVVAGLFGDGTAGSSPGGIGTSGGNGGGAGADPFSLPLASGSPSLRALLEATALMFVAYTGYGRVATLGEEVRDPTRTIPKAILSTLAVSALLYLAVAFVSATAIPGEVLVRTIETAGAPLETLSRQFGVPGLPELIAAGAILAMAGVLLNLLLGISRVLFAMGRRGDMPRAVTRVDARRASPFVAVGVVGGIIAVLTVLGGVKTAWSFSAFTVLVYYSLTNLAALRLAPEQRLYPRIWALGGLVSCAFLAFWVEPRIWIVGLAVLGVGIVWHVVARARAGQPAS